MNKRPARFACSEERVDALQLPKITMGNVGQRIFAHIWPELDRLIDRNQFCTIYPPGAHELRMVLRGRGPTVSGGAGDWLVRHADGTVSLCAQADFLEEYRPI